MNIAKQATARKWDTNLRVEAEQYSFCILKNWMIPSVNVLINNILIKRVLCVDLPSRKLVPQTAYAIDKSLVLSATFNSSKRC